MTLGVNAADWPRFLGPNQNSTSAETGLMNKWPAKGPKQLWTIPVEIGFGGAAVVDNEIYMFDHEAQDDPEEEVLRVLDLATGKEKWRFAYETQGRLSHPGSRSTPTVDGDFVYIVGGFGHVHCVNRKTQKSVWSLSLTELLGYDVTQHKWGYAQSPLVHNDLVIVSPTGPDSPGLVGLNKKTGKLVWSSEAKFGGDFYASPMVRTIAGREGVIINANLHLAFIDPANGKTIWKFTGWDCKFPIPTPTLLPDGKHLFVTGGYGAGSVMIRVDKKGKGFEASEVWRLPTDGSQLHPGLFYKGHLYVNINENDKLKGDAKKDGGLACIVPRTGEILWRTGEDPNYERGNLLLADDKIIIMDGYLGELALVKPDPKRYIELSRVKVFPASDRKKRNEIWSPMALSDGYLIVRDFFEMKCFDLRDRQAAE
jgi:outer membrane protein assembly factor BamB